MPAERARVLIVAADAAARDRLHGALAPHTIPTDAVATAGDAADRLDRADFAAIVLHAPAADDAVLDALHALRAHEPPPEIVVVVAAGAGAPLARLRAAGAAEAFVEPVDADLLHAAMARAVAHRALVDETLRLRALRAGDRTVPTIVTATPAVRRVRAAARRLAQSDESVLLHGEPGTGRTTLARFIHAHSPRAEHPFVALDATADDDGRLAERLFGRARTPGLLELTDGGTLLLRQVELTPDPVQAALVRALETGEVQRAGTAVARRTNVRLLAATAVDLDGLAARGRFRRELYFRLAAFELALPPLRDRPRDIPPLFEHFLAQTSAAGRITRVERAVWDTLRAYDWPGNVAELRHLAALAAITCRGTTLTDDALPYFSLQAALVTDDTQFAPDLPLHEVERLHIIRVLDHHGGNKVRAARALGITTRTLYNKLRAYGLRAAPDADAPR